MTRRSAGLAALLKEHQAYMKSWRSSGKPVLKYKTPCCHRNLQTPAPPAGETWDSMVTCPYCGSLHLKIVTNTEVKIGMVVGQLS